MKIKWNAKQLNDFANRLQSEYEFTTTLMTATQKVARVLHQHLLGYTPVKTGNLRKMWSAGDNLRFEVEEVDDGYEVTFINLAQNDKGERYGIWVNDGHRSPNGGWVMGRFFVEKSIIATEDKAEEIIYKELEKWWKWCING